MRSTAVSRCESGAFAVLFDKALRPTRRGECRTWPGKDDTHGEFVSQIIQVVGSLLVLSGFALAQWGVLDQKSLRYLMVNTLGSGTLAINATYESQWGFLLLEGVWAIVSVISLSAVLRRRKALKRSSGSNA